MPTGQPAMDPTTSSDAPLLMQLAKLIADPDFQRLHHDAARPNLFRILGRTFSETWHSAFLGWLLCPDGSHGLGEFALQRFLVTIAHSAAPPAGRDGTQPLPSAFLAPYELAREAMVRDWTDATVLPNERARFEQKLDSDKRIDVWIQDDEPAEGEASLGLCPRILIIVEQKVKAGLSPDQSTKYPEYIETTHSNSPMTRGCCVFLAPGVGASSALTSHQVTGDGRWYCLDYQDLYDGVLKPCIDRGAMLPEASMLMDHYVRNLRADARYGSLAMSAEDRDLVRTLAARYRETLLALARALAEDEEPALQTALEERDSRNYGKGLLL